jgi:pimeloyl-ACP methyl ester carboxylesterase
MAEVHQIRTPTIILVGDTDLLTPLKYARFLHEHIAGSQLVVLPGAGHSLPTEHTAQVTEHVAAFLRGVARPEALS